MRSFYKFLYLPKSSSIASSIGVAVRFDLPGVVTIARAIGKLFVESDDPSASAAIVVELGVTIAG